MALWNRFTRKPQWLRTKTSNEGTANQSTDVTLKSQTPITETSGWVANGTLDSGGRYRNSARRTKREPYNPKEILVAMNPRFSLVPDYTKNLATGGTFNLAVVFTNKIDPALNTNNGNTVGDGGSITLTCTDSSGTGTFLTATLSTTTGTTSGGTASFTGTVKSAATLGMASGESVVKNFIIGAKVVDGNGNSGPIVKFTYPVKLTAP